LKMLFAITNASLMKKTYIMGIGVSTI
jgi:hypothetical protein